MQTFAKMDQASPTAGNLHNRPPTGERRGSYPDVHKLRPCVLLLGILSNGDGVGSPIADSGRKIVRNAITRESYVRDITALLGDKKGIAQRTVDLIAKLNRI